MKSAPTAKAGDSSQGRRAKSTTPRADDDDVEMVVHDGSWWGWKGKPYKPKRETGVSRRDTEGTKSLRTKLDALSRDNLRSLQLLLDFEKPILDVFRKVNPRDPIQVRMNPRPGLQDQGDPLSSKSSDEPANLVDNVRSGLIVGVIGFNHLIVRSEQSKCK
jgi:hypothetical protein